MPCIQQISPIIGIATNYDVVGILQNFGLLEMLKNISHKVSLQTSQQFSPMSWFHQERENNKTKFRENIISLQKGLNNHSLELDSSWTKC